MGFYVELYCDTVECPFGADQEGPQGTHKAKVAAEARRYGWKKIGSKWLCAGCVASSPTPMKDED